MLYPSRLPTFRRLGVPAPLAPFVRWFWISEWNLAEHEESPQHLIGFPACNLVVETDQVGLSGPTTAASVRTLTGQGWAVGALLKPAAIAELCPEPASLRDTYRVVDLPDLHEQVSRAMSPRSDRPQVSLGRIDRARGAVDAYADWLCGRVPGPTPEGLLANRIVETVETEPAIVTVAALARHCHLSERSLQRIVAKYVGLTPLALIRRRRVQEAAERVRSQPQLGLAQIAEELGYADQAHLAADFRRVLGVTPTAYRARASQRLP